jgi:hypothetical protein
MVDQTFDNSDYGIHSYEAIELIKEFFHSHMPEFQLVNSYAESPFWGITYSSNSMKISILGDAGFSVTVAIEEKEFSLWQYDRTVNNAMKTNKTNILYQLRVLKRFFTEIDEV